MAEIFKYVDGELLERLIGRHRDVQKKLEREAEQAGLKAESVLRKHRDTGRAKIKVEKGDALPDHYVILDDPNAFQIEYGYGYKGEDDDGNETKKRSTPVLALTSTGWVGDED